MEGVLEKSLAEEKFEKLLLQEQQALEKQARLLSNSYQGARVLLSEGNDDDQFNVYGLLQNRDLLVSLEPSLSDQFDILQYFYDNNLLDVDQVLIAVNNIRSHKTMLRCVNEANKTVRELNSVQKKIKASKSMSVLVVSTNFWDTKNDGHIIFPSTSMHSASAQTISGMFFPYNASIRCISERLTPILSLHHISSWSENIK